jgi:hypothetical protein
LNSSTSDHVYRVGTTDAICCIGALDTARFSGFIMGCLSLLGVYRRGVSGMVKRAP